MNTIYNEDCLEGMKRIEDKSIDLIINDPPYNINKAEWDKWKKQSDYIEWMGLIFLECQRVLKDNGSFYFFHNDFLQIVKLQQWLEINSKFVFKQLIVWNKKFKGSSKEGFLQGFNEVDNLRNYQKMAEYILYYTFQNDAGLEQVLSKDNFSDISEKIKQHADEKFSRDYINKLFLNEGRYTSELSAKVHASYKMGWSNGKRFDLMDEKLFNYLNTYLEFPFSYENLKKDYGDIRGNCENLRYKFNNQKTHHSVWNYEISKKQGHITPKPTEMIENIILHSSSENDLVLDCFIGSGTTAIAAINTNRNFIGYELDKTYFDIAQNRIIKHKQIIRNQIFNTVFK